MRRPSLRWAPSHEREVVMLFGILLSHVEGIAQVEESSDQFPGCVAVSPDGRLVRIEFEVAASGFQAHGHDPGGCDLIVCWVNDWPQSPIPVLELKELVRTHAPWAVERPERRKPGTPAWDEPGFLSQATPGAAAVLEGIQRIVAQHPRVLALDYGQGDRHATAAHVKLLRVGSGAIYVIHARGVVSVDFTRFNHCPDLQAGLRWRLAPLGQKALTEPCPDLPAHEPYQREVLFSALAWLAEALEPR